MDKMKIDETLALHCKEKLTYQEVNEMLEEHNITPEEYNSKITQILGQHKQLSHKSEGLPVRGNGKPARQASNAEAKAGTMLPPKVVRKNLESFYGVDMCPSFLMHDALLANEDYRYILEIYSDIYGLGREGVEEMSGYLEKIMNGYLSAILNGCGDDITLEKLREIINQ